MKNRTISLEAITSPYIQIYIELERERESTREREQTKKNMQCGLRVCVSVSLFSRFWVACMCVSMCSRARERKKGSREPSVNVYNYKYVSNKHLHAHWRMNCIVVVPKRNRIECFVFIEEIITHSAYLVACYDEARNVIPSSYKYAHLCADRVYTHRHTPSLVCIRAHESISLCLSASISVFSLAATHTYIFLLSFSIAWFVPFISLFLALALLHSIARV